MFCNVPYWRPPTPRGQYGRSTGDLWSRSPFLARAGRNALGLPSHAYNALRTKGSSCNSMPLGSRLIPLVNLLPQRKTIFPKFVQCFLHFIVVAPLGCASYRKLDAVCEMVLFLAVRGLNQAKQQSAP